MNLCTRKTSAALKQTLSLFNGHQGNHRWASSRIGREQILHRTLPDRVHLNSWLKHNSNKCRCRGSNHRQLSWCPATTMLDNRHREPARRLSNSIHLSLHFRTLVSTSHKLPYRRILAMRPTQLNFNSYSSSINS